MLELRIILVMAPPLLADLIRHVVTVKFKERGIAVEAQTGAGGAHVAYAITAEVCDIKQLRERVMEVDPHVIILGAAAAATRGSNLVQVSGARVLSLSADLAQICGPAEAEVNPLTPDRVADLLLAIAQTI